METKQSIPRADFAIITVIPEESAAVLKVFPLKELKGFDRLFYFGKITSSENDKEHAVLLARCLARGNNSANTLTAEVINLFKPTYVVVVGIAGGVSGRDDIRLGDVVVHDDLQYYELVKQSSGENLPRTMMVQSPSAALLYAAEKVRARGQWSANIKSIRPTEPDIAPKLLIGQILTGEKLMGDPNAKELRALLTTFDKALAVEMESGGVGRAIYENQANCPSGFLVVRGISDFCNIEGNQETRDAWKVYASESAATAASAIIQAISARSTRHDEHFEQYKMRLRSRLRADLGTTRDHEFTLTFSTPETASASVTDIGSLVEQKKRVLLRGYAGGGKSVMLRNYALDALDQGHIPILLDLKAWNEDYSVELENLIKQGRDNDPRFEVIFRVCVTDINKEMIDSFPSLPQVLMVDGLNEVFGQNASKYIIDVLDEYVRVNAQRASVLVTDRKTQRDVNTTRWVIADLDLLSITEVEKDIVGAFGQHAFDALSEQDRKLLSIPYYLNIALKGGSPQLGSAAKAIELYFSNQVRLEEQELKNVSDATFNVLRVQRSSSFNVHDFGKDVPESTINKLAEAGAIKISGDGSVQFEHQLHQDYLVSRYLVAHPDEWNAASFDIVSFDSQSVEPLEMVLEQLMSEDSGDRFLTTIYDWNWGATVSCLANAAHSEQQKCSREMEYVILSVVAEKRFDPIHRTRERADKHLSLFPLSIRESFDTAVRLEDVFGILSGIDSSKAWFQDWRALFTRTPSVPLEESDLRLVSSEDSVLGWTAANVIRRFTLTGDQLSYLRGTYDNSLSAGKTNVAWRVVHALGKSDTQATIDLLFRALGTNHKWVRYGAARSLVELAALTDVQSRRRHVLERLKTFIPMLDTDVLREISNAVFYRDAPDDWNSLTIPLLEVIRDKANTIESDKLVFEEALEKLKQSDKGGHAK